MEYSQKTLCCACKKKIELAKANYLPGKTIYDKTQDMTYSQGKYYCDSCFKEFISNSITLGPEKTDIKHEIVGSVPRSYPSKSSKKQIRPTYSYKPKPEYEKEYHFQFEKKMTMKGYITFVSHRETKDMTPYKVVRFKDNEKYFFVWNWNLFEKISSGKMVEITYAPGKYPHIIAITDVTSSSL
jgi:hypothetical protein